jgi:flagellar biosynthesis GTPase FlhF
MDSCDFKCNPTAAIGASDIIKDTYNDDFVNINHTRISERLRQLFKEKAFYKRLPLINSINIVKQYPIEQIYSTLTHFIKNKNEYLVDRYGRRGNLVNRDDVYAFQPVEINDERISIYERETPIDFKHTILKMEVPKEFSEVPESELNEELSPRGEPQGTIGDRYAILMRELNANFVHATTAQQISKGEKDWYKQASQVVDILQLKHKLGFNEIKGHIARHMIDILSLNQKSANLLNEKEIILLLGSTGCGKSTTVHYLCGSKMKET